MGQIIALLVALAAVGILAWWSEQVNDDEELTPDGRRQWDEHFRNIWD